MKDGMSPGSQVPPSIGLYEVWQNPQDENSLFAYWDGNYFLCFGKATRYSHSGVFAWRWYNRIPARDRVKLATRTESPVNDEMIARFSDPRFIRLLHAAMGMVTEAGEFIDQLKKHGFYGKPLDEVNLMEELGDQDWYMNLACDILGATMEMIEVANIKKLAARYGEKFSKDGALIRNLGLELLVLENALPVQKKTTIVEEHLEHGNIQSQ